MVKYPSYEAYLLAMGRVHADDLGPDELPEPESCAICGQEIENRPLVDGFYCTDLCKLRDLVMTHIGEEGALA